MPPISKTFIASLLGSLIVAGCGGGGSSGGTATTFPLSTALAKLYATGTNETLTVTGTATSVSNSINSTFTAQVVVADGPANAGYTFNTQPASQISVSLTGNFNIPSLPGAFSSTAQDFLSPSNQLMGAKSPVSYCVANTPGQYPDTVTVGQAQSVVTYACSDHAGGTAIGVEKISFIVSAGSSPGTAIFSTMELFLDTNGIKVQYIQKNYLIDTSGTISLQSLSFFSALASSTPSDLQLTFKSQ